MSVYALSGVRREERRLAVVATSLLADPDIPRAVVKHVEAAVLELRDAARILDHNLTRPAEVAP